MGSTIETSGRMAEASKCGWPTTVGPVGVEVVPPTLPPPRTSGVALNDRACLTGFFACDVLLDLCVWEVEVAEREDGFGVVR